jgi:hypothetical protein
MNISSTKLSVVFASAVMLSIVGPLPTAAAPGCGKTYFSAEGYDTDTEDKARGAAHFGWEKAVRASSYGAAYADWTHAQNKTEKCSKGPKYYTCKVLAQPCP